MLLLTKANRKALPKLYANENLPASEAVAIVKFFTPDGGWTFYASEFDGEDTFFGYVVSGIDPSFSELGYFSFAKLTDARGPLGLPIERDRHFTPTKLGDISDVRL